LYRRYRTARQVLHGGVVPARLSGARAYRSRRRAATSGQFAATHTRRRVSVTGRRFRNPVPACGRAGVAKRLAAARPGRLPGNASVARSRALERPDAAGGPAWRKHLNALGSYDALLPGRCSIASSAFFRCAEKIGTICDTPSRSTPSFSVTVWPLKMSGALPEAI